MEQKLKQLRLVFLASFAGFAIFSIIIYLLKKNGTVEDMLTVHSKITVIAMLLMLVCILAGFFIYDRYAKKSKSLDMEDLDELENARFELFKKGVIAKMAMFSLR